MYVTRSNKKASLLCFVLSLDNSCERKKNFFKFHGRYVTSMSIVLAVTDFSEKKKLENTVVFNGELLLN